MGLFFAATLESIFEGILCDVLMWLWVILSKKMKGM